MTEPTQAQIEEAGVFAEAFQLTHKNWDVFEDKAMAKIISHIRREATNSRNNVLKERRLSDE